MFLSEMSLIINFWALEWGTLIIRTPRNFFMFLEPFKILINELRLILTNNPLILKWPTNLLLNFIPLGLTWVFHYSGIWDWKRRSWLMLLTGSLNLFLNLQYLFSLSSSLWQLLDQWLLKILLVNSLELLANLNFLIVYLAFGKDSRF